jgi:hypothetical protein
VFEGLSKVVPEWIAELSAHLRAKNWNPTIVVSYRSLSSWLSSKYNSLTKDGKNPTVSRWPDDPVCQSNNSTCKRIEPFTLNMPPGKNPRDDRFAEYVEYLETNRIHPSHISYLNFAQYFDDVDVRVLPLHLLEAPSRGRGDPMLERLFCGIVPDAPETCRAVRDLDAASSTAARNPFDLSPDYDRLAVHAHETGAYDHRTWNLSRPRLRVWTRLFHERVLGGAPFPKHCWNRSELDRMERLSWSVEVRMFWNLSGGGGTAPAGPGGALLPLADESRHRRAFEEAVQKRQYYCWVDANRTLEEDPRWRSFYEAPYQTLIDAGIE